MSYSPSGLGPLQVSQIIQAIKIIVLSIFRFLSFPLHVVLGNQAPTKVEPDTVIKVSLNGDPGAAKLRSGREKDTLIWLRGTNPRSALS